MSANQQVVDLLNMQAVDDKVFCVLLAKSNVTEGGIITPADSNVEPQKYGKVLSVGEKVKTIKKDDVIIFHPNGGQAVFFQGIICQVLGYSEIYGVVKSEENSDKKGKKKNGK